MDWKTLDSLLDNLELLLSPPIRFVPLDWNVFWDKAKEIQDGFRSVRYPTKEERETAWRRFNKLRDEASRRRSQEKKADHGTSMSYRDEILSQVESARPRNLSGFDPPDVEDMKAYGASLREARRKLSANKASMLGEHKKDCFEALVEMQKVHDLWWEDLKKHRERNREDRRARILKNIEENRERYRKTAEALERTRAYVDDLRNKIASAWNDGWRYDAENRASEAEDRIRDMENTLKEIERWIEEDEGKL